jgi:hypothetical protein
MARLAPIALLAFAVTLACGRPAAPTATPASPAATPTPPIAATAPAPAPTTVAPTTPPSPAQPTQPAPGPASPTVGQTTALAFQGYESAWEKVERFRVEIEYSQDSRIISRFRMLIVRPDRLHLIALDPDTGAPATEIIKIGNETWTKFGDRWIHSPEGAESPIDTSQLWSPDDLSPRDTGTSTVQMSYEELPPETLDGVPCDRWRITIEIPGMGKSETTAWIGQADGLPRQVISVTPEGIRQLQRYSYDGDIDVQPPR